MTTVKNSNFPKSAQCEHSNRKHHSRGKCLACYHEYRQWHWARQSRLSLLWVGTSLPVSALLRRS